MKMKSKIVIIIVAFLLFLTIGSSKARVETLRGGLDADTKNEREEEVIRGSLKILHADSKSEREEQLLGGFLTNLLSLGISIPRAVAAALFNFINFFWAVIIRWFLFLTSSIATTTTTTTTTTLPTTTSIMATSTTAAPVTTTATTTRAMSMSISSADPAPTTPSTQAATTSSAAVTTSSAAVTTTTSPSTAITTATTTTMMSSTTTVSTTSTASTTSTLPPRKYVFVTRRRFSGSLEGVEGADNKCAMAAGNITGTFLAWISNDTVSPSTRFVQSTDPYFRLDDVLFANSYSSLVNDGPLVPLNVDEKGEIVDDLRNRAWTDTRRNGTQIGDENCDNWMGGGSRRSFGAGGNISSVDSWTTGIRNQCVGTMRLYCFEQ